MQGDVSEGVLTPTVPSEDKGAAERATSGTETSTSGRHLWGEDLQVCIKASLLCASCVQFRGPVRGMCDAMLACWVLQEWCWVQVTWRSRQNGVVRYNCADSLDRTNAASYFGAVQVMDFCRCCCEINVWITPSSVHFIIRN